MSPWRVCAVVRRHCAARQHVVRHTEREQTWCSCSEPSATSAPGGASVSRHPCCVPSAPNTARSDSADSSDSSTEFVPAHGPARVRQVVSRR